MFEPLIKVMLKKLDVAAEAYLERQQIINLLAVPGTVLFLLLFWAFSGAGGFMLLLGLFLTAAEVGIAVGLFLLKDRYEEQLQDWVCAADAMEAHLTGSDVFGEWTDFLSKPAGDPELEQIRAMCQVLPDQYPPTEVGDYCNAEGVQLMHESIERLRIGIVSKGYEDFLVWWAARQEAKDGLREPGEKKKRWRKKKKKDAPEFGGSDDDGRHPTMRVAKMSGGILDHSEQLRIDREADKETKLAGKEAKREAKRATRTAKKATKQAMKAEKKLRHRAAMMESMEDEMLLYQEEEPRHPQPHQVVDQPMQAPPQHPAEEYEEQEQEYEPKQPVYRPQQRAYEQEEPAAHHQIRQAPPPAPTRRRQRGLTEAAAIQQVMKSGLTAHHYDDAQHRLAERLGRDPKPAEVVKALKSQFSKKSKKRAAKQEKAEAKGKKRQNMQAFRIDAGNNVPKVRARRPAGAVRTFARAVFVMALVAATPFAMWRIPRPETKPITISGEVHHQLLDHAPDIQHQLRTPFEELLGYKAVMLIDGERIYVTEEDYGLCWPESWDAIYAGRYSVMITAEVTTLLFGGYSVATVTSAERVDRPVATGTDYSLELESELAPEQWRPTRRIHRPRLGR